MKEMRKSKIEIKKVCSICNLSLENYDSCFECGIPILLASEFYCSDWGEESSHTCKECKELNDKDCCPGCGSKSFSKYGVDAGNGVTFIVFGCRDCKNYNYQTTWTRKKRKFR